MRHGRSEAAMDARRRTADPEMLEALVDRFASCAYRVAHAITGSAHEAEGVVQQVFLALARPTPGSADRSALTRRVYRLTIELACSGRDQVDEPLEAQLPRYRDDGHREGDRAFLLADWSRLGDDTLLSDAGRRIVAAAVQRLPVRDRAVLILRDLEALASYEVAEILGEPVGWIDARLHRARMALREQITRAYAPIA